MFENKNNWPLEHWHIEISSRCSLQCPRCTRQEVPGGLINTDLKLEWFEKNFSNIITHAKKITFCGDDGDPIYASEFLQVCEWIKSKNKDCQLVIITNGSGKKKEFWQKLGNMLTDNDHIHFSIDGDKDTNIKYRVNADWDSIMLGIDTLRESTVFKTWAAIAFSFNYDSIHNLKQMARDKGFDYFQLTKSSKFGSNYSAYPKDDPLEPSEEYVSEGRFVRDISNLSGRKWINNTKVTHQHRFKTLTAIGDIQPLCYVGNKGLYVNSQGKFFPCCWTGLRYSHNNNIFDYVDQTGDLEQTLNDPAWKQLNKSFQDKTCPQECKEKCTYKKWSYDHATQW